MMLRQFTWAAEMFITGYPTVHAVESETVATRSSAGDPYVCRYFYGDVRNLQRSSCTFQMSTAMTAACTRGWPSRIVT